MSKRMRALLVFYLLNQTSVQSTDHFWELVKESKLSLEICVPVADRGKKQGDYNRLKPESVDELRYGMKRMWKKEKIDFKGAVDNHKSHTEVSIGKNPPELAPFVLAKSNWNLDGVWQQGRKPANPEYLIYMFRRSLMEKDIDNEVHFFLVRWHNATSELWWYDILDFPTHKTAEIQANLRINRKDTIQSFHEVHMRPIRQLEVMMAEHQSSIDELKMCYQSQVRNELKEKMESIMLQRDEFAEENQMMRERDAAKRDLIAMMKERDDALEQLTQLKLELVTNQQEKRHQSTETSDSHQYWILIGCFIGGAVLLVIAIIVIVLRKRGNRRISVRMERALSETKNKIRNEDEPLSVIPNVHVDRMRVNKHPAVRDKFGMNDIFDVTPGEGKDLVRIARPLETAGAERKLSEELMDIQPIIIGQEPEGVRNSTCIKTGDGGRW